MYSHQYKIYKLTQILVFIKIQSTNTNTKTQNRASCMVFYATSKELIFSIKYTLSN